MTGEEALHRFRMVATRRFQEQQDDGDLNGLDIPMRLTRSNRRELMGDVGSAGPQKEELDDEEDDEDSEEDEEDDDEPRQGRRRSSRVSEMTNRQRSTSANRNRERDRNIGGRSDRSDSRGRSRRRSLSRNDGRDYDDSCRHSRRISSSSRGVSQEPLDFDPGRRRSARFQTKEEGRDEEDDEEEDEDDEESESDGEGGRKYSFRDRAATTRRIINIENLGGDGAGMKHSEKPKKRYEYHTGERETAVRSREFSGGRGTSHDSHDRGGRRYTDQYARYNFGGKYDPTMGRKRRRSGGGHRHRGSGGRRHYDSSSESSSSGSDRGRRRGRGRGGYYSSEDDNFHEYERRRMHKERDSVQPMNFGPSSSSSKSSMGGSVRDHTSRKDMLRVDALPVAVDSKIGFQTVGGLDRHVNALKEMVVLPLLYPEVFSRFDTQPPRGVLFTGPPGTGKTLTARALANSVSASAPGEGGGDGSQGKVSFFMRKGADCLSKWVGEGERQLRLLFEQAKRYQPSIIFFDEIDGLAPVRSVKQDQIHASIVSTLLALMDGLDSRGQVVVIGATNRPDAIDPALRRPGRFDRELTFTLPDARARLSILDIHTGKLLLATLT